MTRNIKILGLALVAVAAMSMAAASIAQASQLHATTPSNQKVVITGHQSKENILQVTTSLGAAGPLVRCAQATYESTLVNPGAQQITTSELTVTPIYNSCVGWGQSATVKMNGCHYTARGEAPIGALTAVVDVVCPTAGKQIEITSAICQAKIPAQATTGGHVTLANVLAQQSPPVNPHHTVQATLAVNNIKHEYTAGVGCGHTKFATTQDADLEGTIHFQAFQDKEVTDQVKRPNPPNEDGHLYSEYTHTGTALGLQAT